MYESADILIVMAMMAEARPLIDHFGLKQDTTSHHVPVFGNDRIRLAISEVGKAQSAVATTYLLATASSLDRVVALNVGVAAFAGDAEKENIAQGDLFLVNSVKDQSAGKSYFPDLLVETNAPQLGVASFDFGVTRENCPDGVTQLVDMEACGFFQAASTFLPPHRIGVVKIVSDFLAFDELTKQSISDYVAGRMPQIKSIVDAYSQLSTTKPDLLTQEDSEILYVVAAALNLTVSQQVQLLNFARSSKAKNNGVLPDISSFVDLIVISKADSKKHFAELRRHLLGE